MIKKLFHYKTNVASKLAGVNFAVWNFVTCMYKTSSLMYFGTVF